jgi:hypothetical protein
VFLAAILGSYAPSAILLGGMQQLINPGHNTQQNKRIVKARIIKHVDDIFSTAKSAQFKLNSTQ